MEENFFEKFFKEEQRIFTELKEIDEFQKEKGEYDCRYITKGFTDRKAYYQIIGETKLKYNLAWVLGEDPYPGWGNHVRLYKREVQKMIQGRDRFDNFVKEKRKANA